MAPSRSPILSTVTALALLAMTAGCTTLGDLAGGPEPDPLTAADGQEWREIMTIADTTRGNGDLPMAAALYDRAHKANPEAVEPLLALGETLWDMGGARDSLQAFRAAVARQPLSGEAHRGMGRALVALDQPLEAAEEFRTALRIEPSDPEAYNGLGVARDMAGDHADAQFQYRRGLALAPDDLNLLNNLGFSYALAGDYGQAIAILEGVTDDPQATARHRQNLALVYGLAGDDEAAARMAALDYDPGTVERNLAYYEWARSQIDAAPPVTVSPAS